MLPKMILFFTILFSSVMTLMTNSWLMIWVMLEINTMTFCSFMKTMTSNKKLTSEWMMKYFIIQSISSAIMIFSVSQLKTNPSFQEFLLFMTVSALMVKAAAAPFHQWFINMTKFSNWKNALLLMTWQKLAPIYLMIFVLKKMVILFVLLSVFIGALLQMNKKNTLEILALSSIFNLSWLILAITLSMKVFMIFLMLYWATVVFITSTLEKENVKSLEVSQSKAMKKWMYVLVILNLAGIPPLINFVIKIFVMNEMMKINILSILTIMLIMSTINLYIYLRMFNFTLLTTNSYAQKSGMEKQSFFSKMIIFLSVLPIMFFFQ